MTGSLTIPAGAFYGDLTLSAAAETLPGTYSVQVKGQGGWISAEAPLTVTVLSPVAPLPAPGDVFITGTLNAPVQATGTRALLINPVTHAHLSVSGPYVGGVFTLRLPTDPALLAPVLVTARASFTDPPPGVTCVSLPTVSDPAAQITSLSALQLYDGQVEVAQYRNVVPEVDRVSGDYGWIYTDRTLTVTGTQRCGLRNDVYALDLRPGWSLVRRQGEPAPLPRSYTNVSATGQWVFTEPLRLGVPDGVTVQPGERVPLDLTSQYFSSVPDAADGFNPAPHQVVSVGVSPAADLTVPLSDLPRALSASGNPLGDNRSTTVPLLVGQGVPGGSYRLRLNVSNGLARSERTIQVFVGNQVPAGALEIRASLRASGAPVDSSGALLVAHVGTWGTKQLYVSQMGPQATFRVIVPGGSEISAVATEPVSTVLTRALGASTANGYSSQLTVTGDPATRGTNLNLTQSRGGQDFAGAWAYGVLSDGSQDSSTHFKYVYVDHPVTVNGTLTNIFGPSLVDRLALSTGWNLIRIHSTSTSGTTISNVTANDTVVWWD